MILTKNLDRMGVKRHLKKKTLGSKFESQKQVKNRNKETRQALSSVA